MAETASITGAEAAYNMVLFQEKKEGDQYGVYRSRLFVRLTKKTPLLERLKYLFLWILFLISYKPEAVTKLTDLSKKQWAKQQQREAEKLETVQNQLTQAELTLQNKKLQLQATDQELEVVRNSNRNWVERHRLTQEASDSFQKQYEALQKTEQENRAKILALTDEVTVLKAGATPPPLVIPPPKFQLRTEPDSPTKKKD